jgi:hypothetical protein
VRRCELPMVVGLDDVGFVVLTAGQKRPTCRDPSLQPLPIGRKIDFSSTVLFYDTLLWRVSKGDPARKSELPAKGRRIFQDLEHGLAKRQIEVPSV